MLKLRRDLSRAVSILEMIKRRERSKRELLSLTLEIVEKRYKRVICTVYRHTLLTCMQIMYTDTQLSNLVPKI